MAFFRNSTIGLRRSAILVGAGVGAALAMVGSPSVAQQAPSLGSATFTVVGGGFVNTPTSIMIQKGFLAKHGVTGKLQTLATGPVIVASLVGGSTDFADANPALSWPLIRQGQCLRYLTAGQGVTGDLVAQADLKLPNLSKGFPESIKDLKGLKIGVVALGSATQIWVEMLLKQAGMSPRDVTFIGVGINASAIAAFQQKIVDVMVVYPPIFNPLQKSPGFQMVANWSKGNPPTLSDLVQSGITTTCKYADANPQIVQAVCRAIAEAHAYMMDPKNEAAMGAFASENMGVSPAEGLGLWTQYKTSFNSIVFTQPRWEAQRKFLVDDFVPKYSDIVVPGCAA